MQDKICLVTGANNGIGFETAKGLAAKGVRVVMLCRNRTRGEAARQKIAGTTGQTPDLLLADLSLQRDIKRVAAEFRERYDRLDVLINIAGFSWSEREVTDEGFERTFALNYLGYFTLTLELVDLLVRSAPARIINIASEAHRWQDISFDNLQGEKSFPMQKWPPMPIMYGWSNMMRIMFTYELAERLRDAGVTANALGPGFVPVRRSSVSPMMNALSWMMRIFPGARTPKQAAETIIWLASAPEAAAKSGIYYASGEEVDSAAQSYDTAVRRRLWQTTLDLTGYDDDPVPRSGVIG